MVSYLERYLAGECKQVWIELVGLGPQIQTEPLYFDAFAVARETMKRARKNLETLAERLKAIEYHFINPNPLAPYAADQNALDEFEKIVSIPLSIRAWYQIIGEVDFGGSHPRLAHSKSHKYFRKEPQEYVPYPKSSYSTFSHEWLDDPYRDREYSQPFSIYSFEDAIDFQLGLYAFGAPVELPFEMHLCLDVSNQAGQSGGGSNWVELSETTADTFIIDVEHRGSANPRKILFVDYLREVFRWGGFPGYEWYVNPELKRFNWSQPPMDDIKYLSEGLLPI